MSRTPRIDEATFLSLVDLIYSAATDSAEWPTVLSRLATTTDSKVATMVLQDVSTHQGAVEWQVGSDPLLAADYRDWAPQNPYLKAANNPLIHSGTVSRGEEVIPDREVCKTAFFNDFLRKIGVLHSTGVWIAKEGTLNALMFLLREVGRPSHSAQDVKLLTGLMPHLQRAVAIQRRLGGLALDRAAAREVLDRLPIGVLMLGRTGTILFFNRTADAILKQRDGLALRRDGLTADSPREASMLRRLVAGVCCTGAQREPGGPLHVSRPSGRRPFSLLVTPFHPKPLDLTSEVPTAAVFVSDPEQEIQPLEVVLRDMFALTPAEARVATLLVQGARVEEVSEQLEITWNTARTHVQRVLQKTESRSQADLVRRLLRSPVGWTLTYETATQRCTS
jgi:DNA-binding CsgD family transcriptional regulator